jgi:hypothetical protein
MVQIPFLFADAVVKEFYCIRSLFSEVLYIKYKCIENAD